MFPGKNRFAHFSLFILFLFCGAQVWAQDELDSLLKVIHSPKVDTMTIKKFNDKNWRLVSTDPARAQKNAEAALRACDSIQYWRGKISLYNTIGYAYETQGDYVHALDNYLNALKIASDKNIIYSKARCYTRIAGIYHLKGDTVAALRYYQDAIPIFDSLHKAGDVSAVYNNIGIIYSESHKYDLAMDMQQKALAIQEAEHDTIGEGYTYNNMALIYADKGDAKLAISYFERSKVIKEKSRDDIGIAAAVINIASMYDKLGDYKKAVDYFSQGLAISEKLGHREWMRNAYKDMSTMYEKLGDFGEALKYEKLYEKMKDTLLNEDNNRVMTEMNTKYKSAEKDKTLLTQKAEIDRTAAESREKDLQRNGLLIGLGLVLVLAFFIFRGYSVKKKANLALQEKNELIEEQKMLVEEKNREIIDSITYARRLQEAILPPVPLIHESLPDSFVLYRPKDIVAGDFYFFEKQKDSIVIAAADCTGHGVPGAMVSVVCANALMRSVKEFGLSKPAEILDKVNELVEETFSRSDQHVQDGMDISLAVIPMKTLREGGTIQWAGANNPLLIVQGNQLKQVDADGQPVGRFEDRKPFTNHSVEAGKNDMLFLFTDGFSDQFGGPRGKKFKSANFKKLLVEVASLPVEQQEKKIDEIHLGWKGDYEQVDDICVIGIRI